MYIDALSSNLVSSGALSSKYTIKSFNSQAHIHTQKHNNVRMKFINFEDESNFVFISLFLTLCLNDFSFPISANSFYDYSVRTINSIAIAITTTGYFLFIFNTVFLILRPQNCFTHSFSFAHVCALICPAHCLFPRFMRFSASKQIFVRGINSDVVLPDNSFLTRLSRDDIIKWNK